MANLANSGQTFMGQSCTPYSFTFPDLYGAKLTNLEANLVTNYSMDIPLGLYFSSFTTKVENLTFCNVSIEYTHPGWNDNINTQVWMPLDNWNGRMQGSGGGGFQTGLIWFAMAGAVGEGYSTVSTDGGHYLDGNDLSWALSSPGNIDWPLVQDFASIALNDAAVIGKAITKEFYGQPPAKSYWSGCSMGGRQGFQIAQRYPTAYDGILAAAPAINLPKFVTAEFWPQMMMHEAGRYPTACEFNAITQAAIEACDELDGVRDGTISSPELCHFDAESLIGKEIECKSVGKKVSISELAVKITKALWEGAHRSDGSNIWPGLSYEAPLTGLGFGLANTECDENRCELKPFQIPGQWIKVFLKRDLEFDLSTIRQADLVELIHQAHQEYQSILAADDPDLTAFKEAGGKLITWHGLADQVIMPNGSRKYWEGVAQQDPGVNDYFRYFEAPGVYHCFGNGPGPYPGIALDQLIDWVENGKAPDSLPARSIPNREGRVFHRKICAYPRQVKYDGKGDIFEADSFNCV